MIEKKMMKDQVVNEVNVEWIEDVLAARYWLPKRNHASNVDRHSMNHRIMVHNNVDMVEDHYSIILVDTCQMKQAFVMLREELLAAAAAVGNDVDVMNSMLEEQSLLVVEVVADWLMKVERENVVRRDDEFD